MAWNKFLGVFFIPIFSNKDIAQCAAAPGSMSLSEAEMKSEIGSLRAENQAMKAENDAMKKRVAKLEAMVVALAAK